MKGKYSAERLLEEITKLDAVQFLGICKIVGVDIYNTKVTIEDADVDYADATAEANATITPRDFEFIWNDLCDALDEMNRVRRRNLGQLVYAATKKEKK